MTQPDVANVVDKTSAILSDNWEPGNTGGDTPIIDKSDSIGKGRDLQVYNYVELSKTSTFAIEYADLPLSSQDVDAAVFVEIKASDEDRRDEIFAEFRRIIEDHRSRPDTPANFDRVIFADLTPLDDETFGAYLYEVTLAFEARSRAVQS